MKASAIGLACALSLGASLARAEGPVQKPEAQAAQLYAEGIRHYNVAEYDDAIRAFKEAYLLTSAPELVYDIAQSYRLKGPGNCGSAAQFYRSYLRLAPTTPRRAGVEAAIEDMDRCSRTETPAPLAREPEPVRPATPSASPALPERHGGPTWIFPVGIAAGVAVAATGGAVFVWSRVSYVSIRDSGCAPSCDSSRVNGPRTAQTVGAGLLIAGGAIAATGFALWLFTRPQASTRPSAWTYGTVVF